MASTCEQVHSGCVLFNTGVNFCWRIDVHADGTFHVVLSLGTCTLECRVLRVTVYLQESRRGRMDDKLKAQLLQCDDLQRLGVPDRLPQGPRRRAVRVCPRLILLLDHMQRCAPGFGCDDVLKPCLVPRASVVALPRIALLILCVRRNFECE